MVHYFMSQKGASANEFASAPFVKQKKVVINHNLRRIRFLAEREGFEPPEPRSSTVFKTAAIDHSAISPGTKVRTFFISANFFRTFFALFLKQKSPYIRNVL